MNSPDVEDVDRFFATVVMPNLLACVSASPERNVPAPNWWEDFVGAPSADQRSVASKTLFEQSRRLGELALKIDVLAALIVTGWLDRDRGYRELALISLSDIGQLTRCAQDVVMGAKHVVEDLDDDLGFGLQDEALDRDLATLRTRSVERYCCDSGH